MFCKLLDLYGEFSHFIRFYSGFITFFYTNMLKWKLKWKETRTFDLAHARGFRQSWMRNIWINIFIFEFIEFIIYEKFFSKLPRITEISKNSRISILIHSLWIGLESWSKSNFTNSLSFLMNNNIDKF